MEPLRVLFAASECAPLVKSGGLGDVIGALPRALAARGVDVRVLLPGYPAVVAALPDASPCGELAPLAELPAAKLREGRLPGGIPAYVLDCAALYAREGGPYQDAQGRDWPDNPLRFGLLGRAAAALALPGSPLAWRPDLLHVHDWQAALGTAYVSFAPAPRPATVITIHNLAFQGIFEREWLARLGLPPAAWSMHGAEYYGKLSFLKAGLQYADAITTVSPTYAKEIQTAPLGMGLEGVLFERRDRLHGILNGIDVGTWDPRTDPYIARRYGASSLAGKAANKRALRRRFGLAMRDDAPVFGMVTRLTAQKGVDLVLAAAPAILALPAQLAIVGSGERELEAAVAALARDHPGAVGAVVGFDEALAHVVEAGADAFLMPSRFEPCGMNQMYSQRYGTIPVVRATGGLADSVTDCRPETLADGTATGFAFDLPTVDALNEAAGRCVRTWRVPADWRRVQQNAMVRDFGWDASAAAYGRLYDALAGAR
jgi:starch synthase